MTEVLEATMLVCFGFSWPMNLIKNIRAKTASSMSLKFIILIITGYVAGIVAKLITHRFNYVLLIYLLNLVVVSANLIVYFKNKKIDKVHQAQAATIAEAKTMTALKINAMTDIEVKYNSMNRIAEKGGVVFFGSDYFDSVPFCELAESFHMEENIHNRSVPHKNIDEACAMVDTCITDLAPQKVFVNLGDADLKNGNVDIDEFISKYEWLLYTINNRTSANMYIVSVLSDLPAARSINRKLKQLAVDHGCKFIDITGTMGTENQYLQAFDRMKTFIRTRALSFYDAINPVTV